MNLSHDLQPALGNFKACADYAPDGCYEQAKQINVLIGDAVDTLMRDIRALGLKASAMDPAFEVEAAIYDYIRRSNPDASVFPTAEGFGKAMSGPARDRVLAQAAHNRDALRALGH